ncbi:hypothetical protein MNBD_ALPHA06-1239 [hydrothermal vent metagenome]|uniref:Uncharacterized protein n=1 Tax=hydrothermal vent metagenome TaxID=652676 RepID=A0A3B0RJ61_9ZZZZ
MLSLSAPTNLALQKASQANISLYARDKIGWAKRMGKPAGKNSG